MTTYRCAACSTILEAEKLPLGNIVEVKPCEACLEAAEEAVLDAADMEDFEEERIENKEGTETGKIAVNSVLQNYWKGDFNERH